MRRAGPALLLLAAGWGCCVAAAPVTFGDSLAAAALAQTERPVRYDPSYFRIPYPNGDIPESIGVCTDVVIRALRRLGFDLQRAVHEDVVRNPKAYGIARPDASIDHRRVPNLRRWFARHGMELAVTTDTADYLPGDIVAWRLCPGVTHIGIVVDGNTVVHNIGAGPRCEEMLFAYEPIGHFRPERAKLGY